MCPDVGKSILGTPKMDPNVRRGPQKCPDGRRRGTMTPKRALMGEEHPRDPKNGS